MNQNNLKNWLAKKEQSARIGILGKQFVEENFPSDVRMINKFERQIRCSYRINMDKDGNTSSYRCNLNSCPICMSFKTSKYIKKYSNELNLMLYKYHFVLTIKNPKVENLKTRIDQMFGFWSNSGLKKNNKYKQLNKIIKQIRSFECSFNSNNGTYKLHFHFILAGENKKDVEDFCLVIVSYWEKYFRMASENKAQYIAPLKKTIKENIKYIFKYSNISRDNINMFYFLLKATKGKRLLMAKNLNLNTTTKIDRKESRDLIPEHEYNFEKLLPNWVDVKSGELLIHD